MAMSGLLTRVRVCAGIRFRRRLDLVHVQVMNPQQMKAIVGDFPVHGFKHRFQELISMGVKGLAHFFLNIG